MNKLDILQIVNLSDKLKNIEWITTLINLNNRGQIEQFFNMLDKSELLSEITQKTR